MDTATSYLNLKLDHPFIAGASPFGRHIDGVKRLEDAGCAAVVLHSVFEEQITEGRSGTVRHMAADDEQFAETLSHFPERKDYAMAPDEYAEHVARVKKAVQIPVIGSMNGSSAESWLRFAKTLEEAGADAVELNLYEVVTDLSTPSIAVERQLTGIVSDVKRLLKIPVAVKVSPFFSAFGNMARQLDEAGADGLVLIQPILSAGHRHQDCDSRASCRAVDQCRATASAAVDRHPARPGAALPCTNRGRRNAKRRREGDAGRCRRGPNGLSAAAARAGLCDDNAAGA